MRTTLLRNALLAVLIGLFSQTALAQDANTALKQVADIVVSLNHFPSDSDKATLATISADESLPQGLRDMATTVSGINHSASAEGKAQMQSIIENEAAPDSAKELAGIIASLNHTASDEAKARLAQLFP